MTHGADPAPTHKKILLTSLAAMVAEAGTFPIDLTKTRLQLHGQSLSAPSSTNAFRIASDILRRQGIPGLYQGLFPAIIRHSFYTPIRILSYENLRNLMVGDENGVSTMSLPIKALIGGASGAFAQIVASPADLVKVRMQADGRMASQGLKPIYSGSIDALSKIVASEGYSGLWKGVIPNIQRAFLVNMGELACYDHAKRLVIQNGIADDNIYAHTMASTMSGLCATSLSCPADVVKTRMMMNEADGKSVYRSSYHCLVKTIRIEGLKALWKGFFPTWARLGPWQFLFWVSYEKFRRAAGMSSF
ncbi:unnamed protein product [Linum trigynum]|uniref:Uncoupling protein 3 n=1 Tax=Linum trigynum TaxID=586398 RepID=A0AAV2DB85_9ROSI